MSTHQQRDLRIAQAKRLGSMLSSLKDVKDHDSRLAMAHDQIADAIKGICTPDKARHPFDDDQVEALIDMFVTAIQVMEPANRPRTGVFAATRTHWAEAKSFFAKLGHSWSGWHPGHAWRFLKSLPDVD